MGLAPRQQDVDGPDPRPVEARPPRRRTSATASGRCRCQPDAANELRVGEDGLASAAAGAGGPRCRWAGRSRTWADRRWRDRAARRARSRRSCFLRGGAKRRPGSRPATVSARTWSRSGTRTSSATAMLAASVSRSRRSPTKLESSRTEMACSELAAVDPRAPAVLDHGRAGRTGPPLRPRTPRRRGSAWVSRVNSAVGDLVEAEDVASGARHVGDLAPAGLRRRPARTLPADAARRRAPAPSRPRTGRRRTGPAARRAASAPRAAAVGMSTKLRVAAEELVAPGAGQGHGHARVAGGAAHEVGVDAVERRLIDGREGVGKLLLEGLLGQHDARVPAADRVGDLLGVDRLSS